ncbi:MAG: NFACT family protein [Candidatus Woesearchaeota archaeon]
MKRDFSGLDLHFLAKELKFLEGSKVEKVYGWGREEFVLRLYREGKKYHLRLTVPGSVHLTDKKFKAPRFPPGYCTFLRKKLTSSRLTKIYQKDFERILVLEFEFKDQKYTLIAELFGQGNLVLMQEGIIVHPLFRQSFKGRVIESKKEYVYPPSRVNPEDLSLEKLKELASDKDIVRFLAMDLGFGGLFAEELVARLQIDKSLESNKADLSLVLKEIINLLQSKISAFTAKGSAFPVDMKTFDKEEVFESFSMALDSFFEPDSKEEEKEAKNTKKKDKLEIILEAQTKRIKDLEKEIEENNAKGEFIYANYAQFSKLLDYCNKLIKDGGSWVDVEKALKENPKFKSFDKKNKKVVLEF